MNPAHSPENLWKLSTEELRTLLLTADGVGSEVKARALGLIIQREVEAGYPERHAGADTPCFICGQPTNSLAANPSMWARHFPHVDGPGKHRCYHVGCLYPILRAFSPQFTWIDNPALDATLTSKLPNKHHDTR